MEQDNHPAVIVSVSDGHGIHEIARSTIFPDGVRGIRIKTSAPEDVTRLTAASLESIARGLRLALAGETDDCMSELEFDQNMRPVASDASRHAVAVLLAGMFANMGDNPPDTTDEAYAQMGDEAKGALERMAGILLDVAREASL